MARWTDAEAHAYWSGRLSEAGREPIGLSEFLKRFTVLHLIHGVVPKDDDDPDWLAVRAFHVERKERD